MILLDTTVLVYAVGVEYPLRAPAQWLLRAHASRDIEATTTVEVLQGFLHIRDRRRSRSDAASVTREYVDAFEVIRTSPADLVAGAHLYMRHPELGVSASALVSADRAFDSIEGLPWIDLADPDFQARLAGDSA